MSDIGSICEVIFGQSPPGETYNTQGIGLPFYQGKAEFGPTHPTPVKWCAAPKKIANANDILISVRAPVGPTNLASARCAIGRGLAALRSPSEFPASLLRLWLELTAPRLRSMATGSTFEAITGDLLRGHLVVVAPHNEMRKILETVDSYLSRLDAAVASLTQAQTKLEAYRASVLKAAVEGRLVPTEAELAKAEGRTYEPADKLLERILRERRRAWEEAGHRGGYQEPAFPDTDDLPRLPEGWVWATTEMLCDASRSITYGVIKLGDDTPDGIPVLRSSNVRHLALELDYVKRTVPEIESEFRRTRLVGGEVLVTVRGTLGGVAVVPPECRGFNVSREVAMLAMVDPTLAPTVALMVGSPLLQDWMLQRARGITYQGVNISTLKELPIPLPPLSEQSRLVAEAERQISICGSSAAAVTNDLTRCSRLRQSILKAAFEGQLVDQDPNDEPASELLARLRATPEPTAKPKRGRKPKTA